MPFPHSLTPSAHTESMSEVIDLVTPPKPSARQAAEITFFDLTDENSSTVSAQGISNDVNDRRGGDAARPFPRAVRQRARNGDDLRGGTPAGLPHGLHVQTAARRPRGRRRPPRWRAAGG